MLQSYEGYFGSVPIRRNPIHQNANPNRNRNRNPKVSASTRSAISL